PSRRSSRLPASEISETRGPTSERPVRYSAGSRRSVWTKACAARSRRLSEPIRVLRAIARLNMGGPALNVAYLAKGLDSRGYQTTLVAGRLAHGEDSMAFVADEMGVPVLSLPAMHRDVS